MAHDTVIGIDLGTTNSGVAIYTGGELRILENREGGRITPSVVFYTEQRSAVVGEDAKKMATAKPEYGVFEIKRLIGRKKDDSYVQNNLKYFPFKLDESSDDAVIKIEHSSSVLTKTPEAISAAILKKIKADVQSKLGHDVEKAVITVPAYFNVSQREKTLEAAQLAGFSVLKLLNEPTAAALSYFHKNKHDTDNYSLVYDLGGGTFDVAILKRSAENIDIVCVDGNSHLGGQDFDNLIIDYVCNELKKRHKYDPRTDRRAMRRLHYLCEEAKRTLSFVDETTINLDGFIKNQDVDEISITKDLFESMSQNLFKQTMNIVKGCLESSGLSKNSIDEVILSGGSTRIPKITELLSNFFDGKTLNNFLNPDECVAEGAALQAAMLSSNPAQRINTINITDATPLSLGVPNFLDLMIFFIKRNAKIPTSVTLDRITVEDQQPNMYFQIYEGERLRGSKNRLLGEFSIYDLTLAPPGQCEVTFTMKIDTNGILTVSAKEKCKNNTKDLKISYTRGHRSDKEVQNALQDAKDHKAEDEKFEKFVKRKQYLIYYCTRCIYNFCKKNLTDTFKEEYELCQKFKKDSDGIDVDGENKIMNMIEEITQKCNSIVQKYNFQFLPNKDF